MIRSSFGIAGMGLALLSPEVGESAGIATE
jgi:hypothetical protein